jgi:hypothetical protein
MANKKQPASEVNPATQQIDFYIHSPQQNPNKPNREVFTHSSAWRSRGSRAKAIPAAKQCSESDEVRCYLPGESSAKPLVHP